MPVENSEGYFNAFPLKKVPIVKTVLSVYFESVYLKLDFNISRYVR